jgi:ferredoxin
MGKDIAVSFIVVDMDRCTGHGRCYAVAPDLFTDDEEGRPIVLVSKVAGESETHAEAAVAACPELAIRLAQTE